jgi:hypothetical protein
MDNLYIVETNLFCPPKLQIWLLLKETERSYLVKLRGGTKRFAKGSGRKFFRSAPEASAYLRAWHDGEYRRLTREGARAAYLKTADEQTLLDYARGLDAAVDRVEAIITEVGCI